MKSIFKQMYLVNKIWNNGDWGFTKKFILNQHTNYFAANSINFDKVFDFMIKYRIVEKVAKGEHKYNTHNSMQNEEQFVLNYCFRYERFNFMTFNEYLLFLKLWVNKK